jgi:hypothetical protein
MTYTKPEVAVLGEAVNVIEQLQSKPYINSVDGGLGFNSAYDLDE